MNGLTQYPASLVFFGAGVQMGARGGGGGPVTVDFSTAVTSPSLSDTVPVTITFSEAVTGFVVGDITVSAGGALESFTTSDNIVFTVNWILAAGANTLDIAAGVCQSAGGQDNEAATQLAMTWGVTVAITPTLGSELVVNPTFEGTYESEGTTLSVAPNWNNFLCDDGSDVLAESATAHGGSKSQSCNVNAADEGVWTPTQILSAAGWYQLEAWVKLTSGAVYVRDGGGDVFISTNTTGSWVNLKTTGRVNASRPFIVASSGGGANWLTDDASAKAITFASMRTLAGTADQLSGVYTCKPTVTNGTQAGMLLGYADDNNFVMAIVDLGSNAADSVRLYKMLSGVWTAVANGSITYSAGTELSVVVSGTSFSLYYGGVQKDTTKTISTGTLGLGMYGFNAYNGNQVGVATYANP